MKNKNFERMKSFSDYVQVMVDGLKKEWVKVAMNTYGVNYSGICYGCAATNALCELMTKPFFPLCIDNSYLRAEQFNEGIVSSQLHDFEKSVDYLRQGAIGLCLGRLSYIKDLLWFEIPKEPEITPPFTLPSLGNSNWKIELFHYEEYAQWLREKGL